MKRRDRKHPALLTLLLASAFMASGASTVQAQWDMGWGFFGGFNTVPSPTSFLNDRALSQSSRGMQMRPSHNPYAGNGNAYFNRIRDNGLVSHYDIGSAGSPAYRPASRPARVSQAPAPPSRAQASTPAAAPAQPKPRLPLGSFFDAGLRLVWPAESPVQGELQTKRDSSDEASLAVLNELKRQEIASITSVAEARQRLLDYGQPALQEVRRAQTPRIADSFHLFLLSLYESLAQAAAPEPATPDSAPQP